MGHGRRYHCRECGCVWRGGPRSPDEGLCRNCYAKDREAQERGSVDWDRVAARLDDGPAPVETTEDELRRARGEGPGPDDSPALVCPAWDADGAERLARVRRSAGDVAAGWQESDWQPACGVIE